MRSFTLHATTAIITILGVSVAACSGGSAGSAPVGGPILESDAAAITPPSDGTDASAPSTPNDGAPKDDGATSGDAGADSADAHDGAMDASGDVDAGCAPGTRDCDGNPANGCEAKLDDDPKNCGACGHDCTALAHVSGGVSCTAGACVVPAASCQAGFAHCSANVDDGCETDLSQSSHCGACATSCTGATPVCSPDGSGGYACSSGCPSGAPDRCGSTCVDTTSNPSDCGACGNACPAPSHATATCAASSCGFACNAGYHNCSGACADNTSTATCGSSCTPCAPPANATATCDGTQCGFACNSGYHACGAQCSDNTSTASCGSSCTPCVPPANATSTCNGTTCGFKCNAGFADCDGNAANGCEVNLATDGGNCGVCGHSCLGGACSAAACQPVSMASISNARGITADTTNVYVLSQGAGGGVWVLPKAGGAPTNITPGYSPTDPNGIVQDSTNIYWADEGDNTFGGYINRTSKAGHVTSTVTAGQFVPWGLAISGNTLWFTNRINSFGWPAGLASVSIAGGSPSLITQLSGSTLTDGVGVWADASGTFFTGMVSGAGLLATNNAVLTQKPSWLPQQILLNGGFLYFTEPYSAAVWRSATDGTGLTQFVTGTGYRVDTIAADATALYIGMSKTGDALLMKVPLAGGSPVVLAKGIAPAYRLLVDDNTIYWTVMSGSVWKLAK